MNPFNQISGESKERNLIQVDFRETQNESIPISRQVKRCADCGTSANAGQPLRQVTPSRALCGVCWNDAYPREPQAGTNETDDGF